MKTDFNIEQFMDLMDLQRFDRYISDVFQPSMVKPARALLYSMICMKYRDYEQEYRRRFRMNVLLFWKAGWFKTSLAMLIGRLMPEGYNVKEILSASSASLRGSFSDGKFFPPEFLLSDVILFSELSSIVKTDDDMMGVLLSAIEEGICRSMAIKNLKATREAIRQVEEYGATFEDGRLCFQNKASVWACSHTLDVIPVKHVDAFVSRFFVVQVEDFLFDYEKVKENPNVKYDTDVEQEIREEITFCMREREPDLDFAYEVYRNTELQLSPREAGDFIRCSLAYHELKPNASSVDVAQNMSEFFTKYEILSPKEKVVRLIKNNPKTHDEICRLTGISKSNVYTILNRMKCLKKRETGALKYYLE